MSLCRLLVPALDSGCGLCITDKRREKYLGKFFSHLPFKEAKCKRKKRPLHWGYSRATSTEDSLWEGCEFCSAIAIGTGRILMKSSTSAWEGHGRMDNSVPAGNWAHVAAGGIQGLPAQIGCISHMWGPKVVFWIIQSRERGWGCFWMLTMPPWLNCPMGKGKVILGNWCGNEPWSLHSCSSKEMI